MPKGKHGGSYSGERRGGRKRDTPNKCSLVQEEAAAAGGLMPLELVADYARSNESHERSNRSYDCHRKLKALEHPGPEEKPAEYVVTLTFD